MEERGNGTGGGHVEEERRQRRVQHRHRGHESDRLVRVHEVREGPAGQRHGGQRVREVVELQAKRHGEIGRHRDVDAQQTHQPKRLQQQEGALASRNVRHVFVVFRSLVSDFVCVSQVRRGGRVPFRDGFVFFVF